MATSVLSKEAGLKGKLERCEKRKKETRQNKKKPYCVLDVPVTVAVLVS